MSSKQSPERGHARRATNEALATSPGHAPKRGRTTSGETASALGCAAQRTRPTRSGTRFLPEASCPAGGELLRNSWGHKFACFEVNEAQAESLCAVTEVAERPGAMLGLIDLDSRIGVVDVTS